MLTFHHDEHERSYTAWHGDREVGRLSYRLNGRRMHIEHTYTDPALRGQGVAGKLTRHVLDGCRRSGLLVVPECSYVATFIDEHSEYSDVL